MNNQTISNKTILALDWLLSLFTEEQRKTLEIESNGVVVSLVQQLTARWWSYEPFTDIKLVFQAKAIQILEAHKGWIEFIDEISKDNIFSKLLRPENYKDSTTKISKLKGIDKKSTEGLSNSAALSRNIGRSISGTSGTNKSYALSAEWDKQERERLDAMKLDTDKKVAIAETGEQDDSEGAIDPAEAAKRWIEQQDRLEQVAAAQIRNVSMTKFSDGKSEEYSKQIRLFDAAIQQTTAATGTDNFSSTASFAEGLRRQSTESTSERLILSDAINNIHNIDFMDVREKFLQKFDVLFNYTSPSCQ